MRRVRFEWRVAVAPELRRRQVTGSQSASPFPTLEGHNNINLTTFRKSGEAVTTPVWYVVLEDKLYVRTEANSAKSSASAVTGSCSSRPPR